MSTVCIYFAPSGPGPSQSRPPSVFIDGAADGVVAVAAATGWFVAVVDVWLE